MKVIDRGFYLGSKIWKNSSISFILSQENGLVKGFTRFTKKEPNVFSILDKVSFEWNSKNVDALGFIKISLHEISKKDDNLFLFELDKIICIRTLSKMSSALAKKLSNF